MHVRPRHLWLLVLTLVVGQWLAVVHGIQHRVSAGEPLVACEVCVAGQAAAGPPPASLAVTLLPARDDAPALIPAAPLSLATRRLPPARGPPSPLV